MCGRFTLATPEDMLAELFGVLGIDDWKDARYNIAPQTKIVTVRSRAEKRIAQSLLWGIAKRGDSRPIINARSETVATSPLFARSFAVARVLIPADGFFEWTAFGKERRARYFTKPGGGPFAFAGLAIAEPDSTEDNEAAVILTTSASESMKDYHDRMPLTVAPPDFAQWLDRGVNPKAVVDLMATGSDVQWSSHPVGLAVNNVRNDSPKCIRLDEHTNEPQRRLF